MRFDEELLRSFLTTSVFGKEIQLLEKTVSTNNQALSLAYKGAPEGAAVLADCQTGGKGRMSRSWFSPPGKNIYTTVILRPETDPALSPQITLVSGVAVHELLDRYCPGRVSLKWPNDVMIGGRKACGILAESRSSAVKVDYIVVGIGININIREGELDETLRLIATSLRIETGKEFIREEVAARLYEHLEKWYFIFRDSGFAPVRQRWLECSGMTGKEISYAAQGIAMKGIVTGMDYDGALLCLVEGKTKRLTAGEITLAAR
jgi:BirA family transcriptional regulator, biotin operon repressor / biotin---[acetyl-CoA-carboxylase] ligase